MTHPTLLDMHAIAERTGLAYRSVRNYHQTAQARRRTGTTRKGDFPPPDQTIGRSPAWLPETIDTWLANRPGRGYGAGRPRKDTSPDDHQGPAHPRQRRE